MSVDLSTDYLGLKLANPLVVSAGPLSDRIELLPRMEEAGAAALVLPSLFEEQIEHHEWELHRLDEFGAESFPEALSYFPALDDRRVGPDEYLRRIEEARRSVSIPVIASLNGVSTGGWLRYAALIEEAGASALELNIYFLATDPSQTSAEVEQRYVDLVAAVREHVRIPLAVKIGPYFSSLPHVAGRLAKAGADGLVLFNRFLQPDIDLETLSVEPHLVLSRPVEARLALRWTAILRPQLSISIAAGGGAHEADDVIKLLLVGADAVQVLSTLLEKGTGQLQRLREGLEQWLIARDYDSVRQMKGSMSQAHCPDPAAFERANYLRTLSSWSGPYV